MTRDEKCRALWAMIEDLSEDELILVLELFDISAHGTPAQQATMNALLGAPDEQKKSREWRESVNALLDEWRSRK